MITGLAPSRVTALACIEQCLDLGGEFWECGVYQGNNALLLKDAIGDSRVLRLFDTFSVCPPATAADIGAGSRIRWDWKTSLATVQEKLAGRPNVFFHAGCIPDTFKGLEASRIAFVYLDLTLYSGTKGALGFVLPRMLPGGKVFIRDYYGSTVKWPGLVRAVDEVWPSGSVLERVDYDAVVTC